MNKDFPGLIFKMKMKMGKIKTPNFMVNLKLKI